MEIDAETGPLTPLPWSRSPVEGLTRIGGRPVVQVDGRDLAGGNGERGAGRWLVVLSGNGRQDEIAVRVDAVPGLAEDAEAPGLPPVEPLPWSRLWQDFTSGGGNAVPSGEAGDEESDEHGRRDAARGGAMLEVLLVPFRGEKLALGLDRVRCVATVEAVDTVTTLGGGRQRLARVEGRLLPALVLSERFGVGPVIGRRAVVGTAGGHEVALLLPEGAWFHRIALDALERVPAVPGAMAWWRRGTTEPPVGLYDFATLAGYPGEVPEPDLSAARLPDHGCVKAWQRPDTVRLSCAGLACSVPLELVGGALSPDDRPAAGRTRPRRSRPGPTPVLDGGRLLTGRSGGRPGPWLRLGPPDGPGVVLVIDGLEPEFPDADHPWLAPPALPAGPAALIEAVRWEEKSRSWVLRLRRALDFPSLPMIAKRAVAGALIGWLPVPAGSPEMAQPDTFQPDIFPPDTGP